MTVSRLRSIDTDLDCYTCSIFHIARRLGRGRLGNKALISYIEGLITEFTFPPPLPCPIKGKGPTRDVRIDSRWILEAVDAWFDDFLPPDCAASMNSLAEKEAADAMDERASNLQLVGGREA